MRNYYFVAAGLPSINLDQELEISFASLMERYAMNLHRKDLEQVVLLRGYFDVENVFHLLRNEAMNPKGNLFRGELEEALLHPQDLPPFLREFFFLYPNAEEQLANSHIAYELYLRFSSKEATGFLRSYLRFERERRLLIAALRAKRGARANWEKELLDEERDDPFTTQLLAQKEGTHLEFPFEFRDLGEKLQTVSKPLDEQRMMTEYRLEKIEDMSEFPLFSFDYLMAYTVRLIILEEIASYDKGENKWEARVEL